MNLLNRETKGRHGPKVSAGPTTARLPRGNRLSPAEGPFFLEENRKNTLGPSDGCSGERTQEIFFAAQKKRRGRAMYLADGAARRLARAGRRGPRLLGLRTRLRLVARHVVTHA